MGASSSAGRERPDARHSIRFTFGVMAAVPAIALVVLWGLAAAVAVRSGFSGHSLSTRSHRELAEFGLLIGAGLAVAVVAAIVMASFARRLSRDITDLAAAARRVAAEQSPQRASAAPAAAHSGAAQPGTAQPKAGQPGAGQPGAGQPTAPDDALMRPRTKGSEIAQATAAIASLRETVAAAAAGEVGLRDGLRQVFVSVARRNQSLLQRQLRLIDALEQKASDPAALADLFALDHLTTRMRRHAESLAILSDAAPGRSWREPVPVIDVIRGAMAEVEDYKRVTVLTRAEDAVSGPAVADMIHLLAELIENATLFSPSGTRVEVRAARAANGFAIEIDDRGLGIEPDQLTEVNRQLAAPPDFDLANADRLGLFVGGKLAVRHGVRVSLRPSPYGGTTAIVLLPNSIVVPASGVGTARPDGHQAIGKSPGLDLRGTEALVPAERRTALPAAAPGVQRVAAAENVQRVSSGEGPQRVPAGAEGPARADQTGAGTYRGLPRRTRQASLSPHLRDSPLTAVRSPGGPGSVDPEAREPEEARNLAASLQRGWRRGRESDPADVPDRPVTPDGQNGQNGRNGRDRPDPRDTGDAQPLPGRRRDRKQDFETPQGEETS
jgi:signal transduction histidine kinase